MERRRFTKNVPLRGLGMYRYIYSGWQIIQGDLPQKLAVGFTVRIEI
jgi:hypothetical protein